MAEWLGSGLQNHAQQFDSAWTLDLLVISFSVINYVVSMSGPRGSGDGSFFLYSTISTLDIFSSYSSPASWNIFPYISAFFSSARGYALDVDGIL